MNKIKRRHAILKKWSLSYLIILIMMLLVVSLLFVQHSNVRAEVSVVSTPTVVDTDINSSVDTYWKTATRLPSQTQTFYAMDRFWCIYRSRDHVMSYKTSSDSTTWGSEIDIFDFGSTCPSAFFDCHINETKIHIVGCNSSLATEYVKYRRGNLNSNGIITWDAPEQNALESNLYWSDPSITVDNNGYAYVSATRWGGNDSILVRKNANNDGTWSTDWSYWIDKYDYNFAQLLTLSASNHVYILYYSTYNDNRTAYPIHGRLWNGIGWSAEETINTTLNLSTQYWSKITSVAVNDDIHVVYSENVSNNITYASRIGGVWGNFTNLYSNANNATGVISYAKDTGDLVVLWQNYPYWNGTYYVRYDNGTDTWNTIPVIIVNETAVGYTQQSVLTCSHESWNDTISCIYLINQSVPATLKHFYIYTGVNVSTNATTGVGQQNATLHGYLDGEGDSGETCTVGFQWGETTDYGNTSFNLSFASGWNPPSDYSYTEYFQFPKDIWLYNLSVESNATCENFCQQGGIYDTVDGIWRYNSTPGATVSWGRDRNPVFNDLTHMDNSTDHPEFYYIFHSDDADMLSFNYDNLTATIGEEFGHQIGIIGGLHLYGLTSGKTYHYRAFATNGTTTVYGNDMTFVTAFWDVVRTVDTTSVAESTATLNGYYYGLGDATITGFWIGNMSTNSSSFEQNVSTVGNSPSGELFTYSATSLVSGEYYYIRAWAVNATSFYNATNETYFITKPYAPSGFTATSVDATTIGLTWTNATVGANTNRSTYIRYKTTGYPTTLADGTLAANESIYPNATLYDVIPGVTYYFTAWTYVQDTGSPSYGMYSDDVIYAFASTAGGNYTITVRYENESIHGNLPVNLSDGCRHRLIIHYADETEEVTFCNGIHTSSVDGNFVNNASGFFTLNLSKTVIFFEFRWNDSEGNAYRCNRIIIPSSFNTTFYIRTDLPVYGETTSLSSHTDYASITNPAANIMINTTYDMDEIIGVYVYNVSLYVGWVSVPNDKYTTGTNSVTIDASALDANSSMARVDYYMETIIAGADTIENSLVVYTYTFKDPSTMFVNALENDAYVDIYWFNSTGIRLTIHREFFSSNDEVYPMLVYDKKYRLGVGCSRATVNFVGLAPTGSNTAPDAILIPWDVNVTYDFFEVIDLDVGWMGGGSGFYVFYQDTLFGTINVTFTVWCYNNNTQVYEESSNQSYINFTYNAANQSLTYIYRIETNHTHWSTNQSIEARIYAGMTPITDITSLDNLLDRILGNTPFINTDPDSPHYGESIPWSKILIGSIAIIVLASFGYVNANLGMMSVGAWLAFAGAIIEGMDAQIFIVGVFLIAMSVVFALGGKSK